MYNQIGSHKTSVFGDSDRIKVVYHSTVVVSFNHETIILNSEGYRTKTTKTRINQTSQQFNLGLYVYQKDFDWFVDWKGEKYPFIDGMVIYRNGDLVTMPDDTTMFPIMTK